MKVERYYCDKCGKEDKYCFKLEITTGFVRWKTYYICNSCKKELFKWFKLKEEKKEK